jgi:pyridoxine kinase
MPEKSVQILCINSLPFVGNAGLKMVLPVLGTRAIPVPTLLLSGIGNMAGHQRFGVPFADLLHATLTLARDREQPLAVYVGYLADAEQAPVIAGAIREFSALIRFVLIDPVCGDNGRAYVPPAVIESWHGLLPLANLALPNLTEAALLTGQPAPSIPVALTNPDAVITAFCQRYPRVPTVITGIVAGNVVTNRLILPDNEGSGRATRQDFSHRYVPQYFSGTGDTFASWVIRQHCLAGHSLPQAVSEAGTALEQLIEQAVATGETDLSLPSIKPTN